MKLLGAINTKLAYRANKSVDSLIQLRLREQLFKQSCAQLADCRYSLSGKTVFCIGNGPSLTTDQIALASTHSFIATNRAYQLFEDSCFRAGGNGWLFINDYWRSIEVLPGLSKKFEQVVTGCHDPKNIYAYKSLVRPEWIFARCPWGVHLSRSGIFLTDETHRQEFSDDFYKYYYTGWSVIFSAIQFAAHLGAKRIVLMGTDMDYTGPTQYSELIKEDRLGIGHSCRFEYQKHGKPHLIACRDGLQKKGVELLNATPAGAIAEIPRVGLLTLSKLLYSEDANR